MSWPITTAVTDGIGERHTWRENQFSTCMVLFERYQFVESLKFIDLTRDVSGSQCMHAIRANFIASYSRSKLDSIRPTGESFSPFVLSFFLFPLPPFFLSKRERERKKFIKIRPLLVRVASFSRKIRANLSRAKKLFIERLECLRISGVCYSTTSFDRRLPVFRRS